MRRTTTALLAMLLASSLMPGLAAADVTPELTITAPEAVVAGEFDLGATTTVQATRFNWAVRTACADGTTTLAGNVNGFSDDYTYDGETFAATLNAADLPLTDLCLRTSADLWDGVTHPRITKDQIFRVNPKVVITSPTEGANITDTSTSLAATTTHDARRVQWAVRADSCTGTTVAGNVDGSSDDFTYDGSAFGATISTTEPGTYCFRVTFDFRRADGSNQRITTDRLFTVDDIVLCKDGGYATNFDPAFRNQGQCIRSFQAD